jgi:hypothetical protein
MSLSIQDVNEFSYFAISGRKSSNSSKHGVTPFASMAVSERDGRGAADGTGAMIMLDCAAGQLHKFGAEITLVGDSLRRADDLLWQASRRSYCGAGEGPPWRRPEQTD